MPKAFGCVGTVLLARLSLTLNAGERVALLGKVTQSGCVVSLGGHHMLSRGLPPSQLCAGAAGGVLGQGRRGLAEAERGGIAVVFPVRHVQAWRRRPPHSIHRLVFPHIRAPSSVRDIGVAPNCRTLQVLSLADRLEHGGVPWQGRQAAGSGGGCTARN